MAEQSRRSSTSDTGKQAMTQPLIAGIEAGGTKILCAVAHTDGTIVAQTRIATGLPDRSFADIAAFFDAQARRHGTIRAGGVASFGPLDLDRGSPSYGRLTTTPKPGWSGVDMLTRLGDVLQAPCVIDTDVNCAALAEARHGAAYGLDRSCYVTIGTGIGVGIVRSDGSAAAAGHPEAGHIRVPRARDDAGFAGVCPYHGDCLEGLASGPAMRARWGVAAEDMADDHAGWDVAAHYIACLCVNLTYTARPQRIVLGGGVMEHAGLHDRVRGRFAALAGGYALDRWSADPASFLVAPALREPSPGLVGAIALARDLIAAGS